MEIVLGSPHAVFAMGDASCVGEARRHGAILAANAGFDEVTAGKLALIVTELGTNLVKHARRGRLMLASRTHGGHAEVEVLSVDEGPGIGNLEQCMADGFSTANSPGTGLGALKRLASDFDIHSMAPAGTVAVARVRRPGQAAVDGSFRLGVVATCAPGEAVCGDDWAFAAEGTRGAALMADGLGHGPEAAEASATAVKLFVAQPFGPPGAGLELAHAAMRATRGAAVTSTLLDAAESSIRSAGAGNVLMRVLSGVGDRTVLSQNGTVGVQIRRPEEVTTAWPRHAVVVLHTDGIMARWPPATLAPVLGRDPSLAAALLARDFCRGRDDATVMVVRRKE